MPPTIAMCVRVVHRFANLLVEDLAGIHARFIRRMGGAAASIAAEYPTQCRQEHYSPRWPSTRVATPMRDVPAAIHASMVQVSTSSLHHDVAAGPTGVDAAELKAGLAGHPDGDARVRAHLGVPRLRVPPSTRSASASAPSAWMPACNVNRVDLAADVDRRDAGAGAAERVADLDGLDATARLDAQRVRRQPDDLARTRDSPAPPPVWIPLWTVNRPIGWLIWIRSRRPRAS
jgi:hypothetical protein